MTGLGQSGETFARDVSLRVTLESTTAIRLVRLRTLLTDAQARAADRGDAGVHAAVIGLDGVCELTVGLAAHECSVDTAGKGGVLELARRLGERLGSAWDQAGLKAFRELHRARNLAQHEGVLPRGSQLPVWSAESERFVKSLIASAFGVDLTVVSAAAAVEDLELREQLVQAERHLDDLDHDASIRCSHLAVMIALRAFQKRRGRTTQMLRSDPMGLSDTQAIKDLHAAVGAVEQFLDIATLASDPGEWLWLQSSMELLGHSDPPFDRDDAQRALAFALNWVLRYEVFSARYVARQYVYPPGPDPLTPYEKPRVIEARAETGPKSLMLHIETSTTPPGWDASMLPAIRKLNSDRAIPDGLNAFTSGRGFMIEFGDAATPAAAAELANRIIDATDEIYEQGLAAIRFQEEASKRAVTVYQEELERSPHQALVAAVSSVEAGNLVGSLYLEVNLPPSVNLHQVGVRLANALGARVDAVGDGICVPVEAEPAAVLAALAEVVSELKGAADERSARMREAREREERIASEVQALIEATATRGNA